MFHHHTRRPSLKGDLIAVGPRQGASSPLFLICNMEGTKGSRNQSGLGPGHVTGLKSQDTFHETPKCSGTSGGQAMVSLGFISRFLFIPDRGDR